MKFDCELKHPLNRDGTNQYERLLAELLPSYAQIDERSKRELFLFCTSYARHVKYWDLNTGSVTGDWTSFFPDALLDGGEAEFDKWLQEVDGELQPHLALFFTFLELFQFAQAHINTLTQRHLDLYFVQILGLVKQEPEPDQIYVLVELAETVKAFRIDQGTEVNAGKDASGVSRHYAAQRTGIIRHSQVAGFKSIYVDRHPDKGVHIFASPQADTADGNGRPFTGNRSVWRLFGERQTYSNPDRRTMQETNIGWALAAPLLRLAEGKRKVGIQFELDHNPVPTPTSIPDFHPPYSRYFFLEVSTVKGWERVPFGLDFQDQGNLGKMEISFELDHGGPAITDAIPDLHGRSYTGSRPVVRMLTDPGHAWLPLDRLSEALVTAVDIEVEVTGISNLELSTESSNVKTGRPFSPFGQHPVPGDRLYIGCPEALCKPLKNLSLQIAWKDTPSDFSDYFQAYGPVQSGDFKVSAEILWDRNWVNLGQPLPMFSSGNSHNLQVLQNNALPVADALSYPAPEDEAYLPDRKCGYLALELNGPVYSYLEAFGHREFSSLYTRRIMELNAWLLSTNPPPNTPEPVLPNSPLTPVIKQLELSYSASDRIEAGVNYRPEAGEIFFLEPFGTQDVDLAGPGFSLLPQFEEEGYFFLGIEGAKAGESIPVLFQLAEGTGNNWLDLAGIELNWDYLKGNTWKPLDKMMRFYDETRGLLNSGIIEFVLPQDADHAHRVLPEDMIWLRARVAQHSAAWPYVRGIHAQAIPMQFRDQSNDPAHLRYSMPAGQKMRLEPGEVKIKKLEQPYASFAGRPAEDDLAYYTRSSERLRHKQRAITLWDYEHLILERFPEIYKAKCIPHTSTTSEQAPGHVSVIVVPELRNKNAVDLLRPSVGQGKLKEIQDFLFRHIPSLFVDLVVENPDYEEIMLEFGVGFHPGYDAGYYSNYLDEELRRFLSPWAYAEGEDIILGGKVHKSKIIKFIEDRPYVDFVVDFKVYHNTATSRFAGIGAMIVECNFIVSAQDVEVVNSSSERAVLISADKHTIKVVEPDTYACAHQGECCNEPEKTQLI